MAINTSNTILSYKTSSESEFSKLCDIVNYPDMGSAPSKLDSTTLTATTMKTSILGLQEAPDITFEANYEKTSYTQIKALKGQQLTFQLAFGEDGADGKFTWNGTVEVYVTGGGVDEVRKMNIVCSVESEITSA